MKSVQAMKSFCKISLKNFNICCQKQPITLQVRYSVSSSGSVNFRRYAPLISNIRKLGLGPTSKDFEEPAQISGPLTKAHATELVLRLNNEERKMLFNALQEYESNRIKEEFEGKCLFIFKYNADALPILLKTHINKLPLTIDKLAGQRWRSKLGRPSKVPTLGDVDPTGTYCPVPEDWLKKKYGMLYNYLICVL